jgi:hypothetical protein
MRIVTGPGSGLASEVTPGGTRIWGVRDVSYFIRITAMSGGEYAWNAVRALPGGIWADLPAPSGTLGTPSVDAAREENDAEADVPQVVRGWREPYSGRMFFSRDECA